MPMLADPSADTILLLLLVVLAVAFLVRRVPVPYTLALVVAGLVIGLLVPGQERGILTPELILTGFLPVLLFEGAYNLPAHHLRRNLAPISLLAVPGVLLATLATAALVHWILGLRWETAFLFGALVAATDPVAVLALFRQLGAPRGLSTIVEGESLFNDGTAFVLFNIVLAAILEGGFSLGGSALDFARTVAGAAAIGSAIGYGGSLLLHTIDDYLVEITATFAGAYGAFILAEHFHFSGVLAVVLCGLFFGNYGAVSAMSARTSYALSATWEFAGFLANSFIFLLIGIALDPETLTGIWSYVAVAFFASLAGRAAVVYALSPLLRGSLTIPMPYRHVLTWGGLRGALSLALVLSLPLELPEGGPFPDRALLQGMTFGVVGASLLLQGLTMAPLLRKLGLQAEPEGAEEYEAVRGRLTAAEGAIALLSEQHARGELGAPEYARLSREYRRRRTQLLERLNEIEEPEETAGYPPGGEPRHAAARAAMEAERAELARLAESGAISVETRDALQRDVGDGPVGTDRSRDA